VFKASGTLAVQVSSSWATSPGGFTPPA
jgi:hypothetical protein